MRPRGVLARKPLARFLSPRGLVGFEEGRRAFGSVQADVRLAPTNIVDANDTTVDALSAKGSGDEVIAMIETRFAAAPACGHCGEADFKPWGSASI